MIFAKKLKIKKKKEKKEKLPDNIQEVGQFLFGKVMQRSLSTALPLVTRSGVTLQARGYKKPSPLGKLFASKLDHEVVGEIHLADAPSPKRACPSIAFRDFSPWGDRVYLSYGQDDLELFRAVLWGPHPPLRGPPSPAGKAF